MAHANLPQSSLHLGSAPTMANKLPATSARCRLLRHLALLHAALVQSGDQVPRGLVAQRNWNKLELLLRFRIASKHFLPTTLVYYGGGRTSNA
eukprot:6101663-Pleurochrysis_carterae.AAC.1